MVEKAKLLAFNRQIGSKFVQDFANKFIDKILYKKNHVKLSKNTFREGC